VSCDTTNPNNPIPIYSVNTTFDKPTVDVDGCVCPSVSLSLVAHGESAPADTQFAHPG